METDEVEHIEQIETEEQHETEFNVIPVQLVESYDGVTLASHSNTKNLTLVKGKYYRQTYRPAWEQMPDFKGWLRGIESEPTRAYCTYCHKTLHAHRLSLLKHTCTIRHQKAAQLHNSRKNKNQNNQLVQRSTQVHTVVFNDDGGEDDEDRGQTVELIETLEYEDFSEHDNEEEEVVTEANTNKFDERAETSSRGTQHAKNYNAQNNESSEKPPISTHVVDTTRGKPVVGLQVSLYKLIDGRWTYINEGVTNTSGNFSGFMERCDFTQGRYKLHYDVDRYFEAKKQDTLYPFIEIVFDSSSVTESYNIPMLLSPYGYSTYRG